MRKALDRSRLAAIYDRVADRYDLQHGLLTARADERGRRILVERAVDADDRVLDCGAGTGSTALLAARKAGRSGQVVLFDLSAGMLDVARRRTARLGLQGRISFSIGDMTELPFADDSFDIALSTYSMCPLYDPVRGALEMCRVVRPGGRLGIAHSTPPEQTLLKWLADRVESAVWRFPAVSLGCRAVSVLPVLESTGCRVVFRKRIGLPLWPFLVFVVEKPFKAA